MLWRRRTFFVILLAMASIDFLASEITKRYGTVQRARGCFLYTRKGVRLTDLYREGGRAILGWKNGAAMKVLKNTLDRGLVGSFDTDYERRIARAVSSLVRDERVVYMYTDRASALKTALTFSESSTAFWKPWNGNVADYRKIDCVIVIPPFPWASALYFVAVRPSVCRERIDAGFVPAACERIPAALAAAAVREIYDCIASENRFGEKDWFIYDTVLTKYWTREGPYLYPKISEARYTDFLLHCLDCAVVASCDYSVPSIVPFGADRGVFTKLKNTPFE